MSWGAGVLDVLLAELWKQAYFRGWGGGGSFSMGQGKRMGRAGLMSV